MSKVHFTDLTGGVTNVCLQVAVDDEPHFSVSIYHSDTLEVYDSTMLTADEVARYVSEFTLWQAETNWAEG